MRTLSFEAAARSRSGKAMNHTTAEAAPPAEVITAERPPCAATPPFTEGQAQAAHEILRQMEVPYSLKTKSLHTLVAALAKHHRPMKLEDMATLPEVSDLSLTSVYRLAAKLNECGMFRRLGRDDRSFYYLLRLPGSPLQHYLTCTTCGKVCEFDTSDPMTTLQRDVLSHTRWSDVRFELELFGRCPGCQGV